MNNISKKMLASLLLVSMLSGCAGMSSRQKGAAVGAAVGGVAGAVMTGGSALGTVGGGAIGGAIGYGVGDMMNRK